MLNLTVLNVILTTLLFNFTTASALPQSTPTPCKAKIFNTPWMLTQITLYQPPTLNTSTNSSPTTSDEQPWIQFNFIDSNPRLRLETVCYGNIDADDGSVQSPQGGYVVCADEDVAFKFFVSKKEAGSGRVELERFYEDDCLGDWPYNYGFAFGDGRVTMSAPLPSTAGALRYRDQMLVNITRMG